MPPNPTTRRIAPPKALTPYQIDLLCKPWYGPDGKATTYTFLKARRIGGSEVVSLRAMMLALGREMQPDGTAIPRTAMDVYITSKEFRSAKDCINKVAENCLQMGGHGDGDCATAVPQGTRVYFPSTGCSVYAVTRTSIRGATGAWIADEFPHTPRQKELWAAGGRISDANLGTESGFPRLIVGTAWEAGSFAHQVFTDPAFPFADNRIVVDIHEAVAQGFPIDPKAAFADLGIQELIDTEYLCRWSRGGGSFFPAEKLHECCEDDDVDMATGREVRALPADWENLPRFWGVDVGGGPGVTGTGRDFTAAVLYVIIGDQVWVAAVHAFNHLGFEAQCDELAAVIRRHPGEVRIDRGSGGGAQMVQVLQRRFAGNRKVRIDGANMSRLDQEKYATKFRRLLDGGQLRLYMGDAAGGDPGGVRALMIELSRLKGKMGGNGHLQLETPRDPLEGHCDRAWAALIAMAGQQVSAGTMSVSGGAGYRPQYVQEIDFDHRGIG